MSTARSVRPTDLVALVSLDGRVYLNEARTWARLGRRPKGPRLLDSGIAPWFSFASGRHTWISVQGQAILGLISAQQRGNRTAWEVDCLIAATDDEGIIIDLFGQLSAAAARAGVVSVYLRLETGSDLTSPARRSGFIPYVEERLLRADDQIAECPLPPELSVQEHQAADTFALYRLYNASVPEAVRRIEAPTFQQWLAMAERRTSGRSRRDYVVRCKDEAIAHVRASRERELVKADIVAHPGAGAALAGTIGVVSAFAGSRRPIFCLVPSYASALERELGRAGFDLDSEYIALVKRTAQPLPVAKPIHSRVIAPHPATAV